jgi:uncharacterized protein YktA (UPF0223 family)
MTTSLIPHDWSTEEALAVVDFLDQLREHIWARYGLRIQEFHAEHDVTLENTDQGDLFDPLPF